jgi:hypothetical protein
MADHMTPEQLFLQLKLHPDPDRLLMSLIDTITPASAVRGLSAIGKLSIDEWNTLRSPGKSHISSYVKEHMIRIDCGFGRLRASGVFASLANELGGQQDDTVLALCHAVCAFIPGKV